jgi:hypothetical protein
MIGTAHQGAAGHLFKTRLEGNLPPGIEFPGRNIAGNGKAISLRLKVLSQRQDLTIGAEKIVQCRFKFCLTECLMLFYK